MKFDTYEDLTGWMTQRGNKAALSPALSYLEEAIAEEAQVLVTLALQNGTQSRSSQKLVRECEQDAREHYLEEINEFLGAPPRQLGHMELVTYRRRPNAWAVANWIHEHLGTKKSA